MWTLLGISVCLFVHKGVGVGWKERWQLSFEKHLLQFSIKKNKTEQKIFSC